MTDPTMNPEDPRPPVDATVGAGDATLAGGPAPAVSRPTAVASERAGDRIGAFTLLEKLGAGGFGVVWKAERREPFVQQVALKLLRPGMDSEAVLARFELERQALARMDHPNIAKVLDGGVTESGRNYFVMELVKGEPITDFCDRNRLGVRKRLELFAQVCDAVQHAHMKGIIHRDLKPGNILAGMNDETSAGSGNWGRVKVIDFGVAKATAATAAAAEHFTQTGQLVGTPEYMSPEQADGVSDIDTRSDIYALGVVLYQLLVGAPPFDPKTLRSAGLAEIHRIIRDVDPPAPSAKLASLTKAGSADGAESAVTIAKDRDTKPESLTQVLRQELEWLPMKAMRKDRNERYRSASEFADDVRNYLDGRALIAGPESAVYRARKFVRRHRAGVLSVIAVAASLLAATVLSTWFGIREARAREQEAIARQLAERRERETAAIAKFQEEMLASVDPARAGAQLARSLETRLDESLTLAKTPPEERSRRLDELRGALRRMNLTDTARDFMDGVVLAPAQSASTSLFREQPEVESALKQSLAITYYSLGMPDRAETSQADALRIREAALTRGDARTLDSLGWSARVLAARSAKAEDLKRAETILRETVDAMRKMLGDSDPHTIFAIRGLADTLHAQDRFDEALALYEQALTLAKAAQSPTSDSVIFSAVSIAAILTDQKGEPARALAVLEPIRNALRAEKEPDPRTCIRVLDNMAYAQGKLAQLNPSPAAWQAAEATNREALELASKALGEEHPIAFGLRGNLAALLLKRGDVEGARALQDRSVQLGRRVLPPTDPGLLRALNDLGQSYSSAGDNARALPLIAEAELGFRAGPGIGDNATQDVIISHARALLRVGKSNEAIPKLEEVLAQRLASAGPSEIVTIDSARELARALALARRFAEADAAFAKAEGAIDASKRPPTSDARWSLVNQWLHTLKAWAAADPKGPAAGKMPAVNAKIEELRKTRLATTPPLPVEWKDI
jgi:serine/threonine protein kinase